MKLKYSSGLIALALSLSALAPTVASAGSTKSAADNIKALQEDRTRHEQMLYTGRSAAEPVPQERFVPAEGPSRDERIPPIAPGNRVSPRY